MNKKVFLWLFLFCSLHINTLRAQYIYKNQNLIELAGCYGFYSPNNKIKSAYTLYHIDPWGEIITNPDKGKYGGYGMYFHILFNVKNSYLKLGAEIGAFTVRQKTTKSSYLYWKDTGKAVESTRFLNGNYLSDFYLFTFKKINIHTEVGLGLLVFWDTDLGFGKAPFDPASELMSSAKLVFSIPGMLKQSKEKYSIDPQIGIIKGFSSNDILVYQINLGFSVLW